MNWVAWDRRYRHGLWRARAHAQPAALAAPKLRAHQPPDPTGGGELSEGIEF
jgi:hypothetical protein